MRMPDHERDTLAEIERRLATEEPGLARMLGHLESGVPMWRLVRLGLVMTAADATALVLLVGGSHTRLALLILAGTVLLSGISVRIVVGTGRCRGARAGVRGSG